MSKNHVVQNNKLNSAASSVPQKSKSEEQHGIESHLAIRQLKLQRIVNESAEVSHQKSFYQKANNPIQKKANNTGLPDSLKTGVENLSGYSMDDVKVHYNSNKPAQLNAHAYAQGTEIHVAPGQEKHLPHEAWHVVQQKQGRVRPTRQLKDKVNINDDKSLEREADLMGSKALQLKSYASRTQINDYQVSPESGYIQPKIMVTQLGQDPIDESAGKPFKYGLIKGTYVPESNTADMHVENKSDELQFSGKDVYKAFSFVYSNMEKKKKQSGIEGKLTWNPQGAAVIKMVAELIGESLGNPELLVAAKALKKLRKESEDDDVVRDENVISTDIIPEHLQYLKAARGAEGIEMKTVIPGNNTEENFDSDMLKDTEKGRSRFSEYRAALESEIPVSLRITISQTQLGMLMDTMKG